MYGTALCIVLVFVMVYVASCASGTQISDWSIGNNPITGKLLASDGFNSSPDRLGEPFSDIQDKSAGAAGVGIDELRSLEGYADQNATTSTNLESKYDPLHMGVVKSCEVESHYKNLKERSPYSTVGTASACKYERDDDEIFRNTGVVHLGGHRKKLFSVPFASMHGGADQPGAREVTSTSRSDIAHLAMRSKVAKDWN